jgi:hypothetical protein
MNRREAFKKIGLGAGFLVASPTVINLLQSCASEPSFVPVFVSPEDGKALAQIVDLIIPSDADVPGAGELGIYKFIDSYWKEVMDEKDQAFVKTGMASMNVAFTAMFNKAMSKGSKEEFDQFLAKYLRASKEVQEGYNKKLGEFMQAVEKDPNAQPDQDAGTFAILEGIRGMTMWGWKMNETIGEEVLWYDPVPGRQDGCIPASEAGNGRVMSLNW